MILGKKCCIRCYAPCMVLVILLAFSNLSLAQTVKVPSKLEGTTNRISTLNVEYEGDDIKWTYNEKDLGVFREYDPDPKKITLKIIPYVSNQSSTIKFIACKGGKLSEFVTTEVTIGTPVPVPPPTPDPIDDPLAKSYQEAYNKETDSNKAELLKAWFATYKEAARVVDDLPADATWEAYFKLIGAVTDKLGNRGKLVEIQKVSQNVLKDRFPSDQKKVMTKDDKVLATQTFNRLVTSLQGIK